LFKHLVRYGYAEKNPVSEVERPAINREQGTTELSDRRGYNPEKAASFFATY
jgi:integrase/recombinase XerD